MLRVIKGIKELDGDGTPTSLSKTDHSKVNERCVSTFKTFRFGCAAMPRASFCVARRPIRLLLKKKKVSKALHYTPLWLMCFRIMKTTVLSKLSRGKSVVERVGKGNIWGAHEPRDNLKVVASHVDVLRGSRCQKNVRGGG